MSDAPTREQCSESNDEMLFMDGYDDCLVGVAMRYGMNEVAAYDYDKVIAKLMADGMTHEEALEWFAFNQIGAWMGDNTPVFVQIIRPETTDTPATAHPSVRDNPEHTEDTKREDEHPHAGSEQAAA